MASEIVISKEKTSVQEPPGCCLEAFGFCKTNYIKDTALGGCEESLGGFLAAEAL